MQILNDQERYTAENGVKHPLNHPLYLILFICIYLIDRILKKNKYKTEFQCVLLVVDNRVRICIMMILDSFGFLLVLEHNTLTHIQ